jgi:hypothetical protein
MGAGTNVQDRLIALHDLDCPWRPSDLEQRSGRIIRQGNAHPEVDLYRYVTEQTFDAYRYQIIENKQKFISQVMTSKSPVRSADDIDETALSYAEIKALATGNPHIKEKMDLDVEVARLKVLRASFLEQKYSLEDRLVKVYPAQIKNAEERISGYEADLARLAENAPSGKDDFVMEVDGKTFTDKAEAGAKIIEVCNRLDSFSPTPIGSYRGFRMEMHFDPARKEFVINLKNALSHEATVGNDPLGNVTRLNNALERIEGGLGRTKENLDALRKQIETAEVEVKKDFPQESDLKEKSERLAQLNAMLDMDEKDDDGAELEDDAPDAQQTDRDEHER